ncbi:hypothetical protein ACFPN2_24670 [Steroidobacter flavus]|uniref:Uncharacterized protein n=1 Tax=Steroidobacter flavus TaxID=1842136 RepID=A0ABV8T0T4_9GAMM
MPAHHSKTPGSMKEVLSKNVRHQQRRANATASPPEAQRPVRERIKSAARKQTRKPH